MKKNKIFGFLRTHFFDPKSPRMTSFWSFHMIRGATTVVDVGHLHIASKSCFQCSNDTFGWKQFRIHLKRTFRGSISWNLKLGCELLKTAKNLREWHFQHDLMVKCWNWSNWTPLMTLRAMFNIEIEQNKDL